VKGDRAVAALISHAYARAHRAIPVMGVEVHCRRTHGCAVEVLDQLGAERGAVARGQRVFIGGQRKRVGFDRDPKSEALGGAEVAAIRHVYPSGKFTAGEAHPSEAALIRRGGVGTQHPVSRLHHEIERGSTHGRTGPAPGTMAIKRA